MIKDGKKLCLNGCFKIKPVADFGRHPRSPDGLQSQCKACTLERVQRHRHGMSAAEKAALATEQGGCAVCRRLDPGHKGWIVDHDHACCPGERSCGGCRRGIVCFWCNTALGYAKDNPNILRALADYLESGYRIDQDSVERVGRAIRLSESHVDKKKITDGLTETITHLPLKSSPSVTRGRAYGFPHVEAQR